MAIEIIDTLKQKNNGTFPLVNAKDIGGGVDNKLPLEAITQSIIDNLESLNTGYLGTLTVTSNAPQESLSGVYQFSNTGLVSGIGMGWGTTFNGITTIYAGDEINVKYTAPNGYVYKYINRQHALSDSITSTSSSIGASSNAVKLLGDIKQTLHSNLLTFDNTNTWTSIFALPYDNFRLKFSSYHATVPTELSSNATSTEYEVQRVGRNGLIFQSGSNKWAFTSDGGARKDASLSDLLAYLDNYYTKTETNLLLSKKATITVGKNKSNKDAFIASTILYPLTAGSVNNILTSSGQIAWSTSPLIPIDVGITVVSIKLARYICFYNSSGVVIGTGMDINPEADTVNISVPSGATGYRYTTHTSNLSITQSEFSSTLSTYETYRFEVNYDGLTPIYIKKVSDPLVSYKSELLVALRPYELGLNKFDVNDYLNNYVIDTTTGALVGNQNNWIVSKPIPVVTSQIVSVNLARRVAYFNSSDGLIGSVIDINPEAPYTGSAPTGVSYCRVMTASSHLNTIYIELNSAYEAYSPTWSNLKNWFMAESFEFVDTLSYDSNENLVTPANIKWPNGATGILTIVRDSNLDVVSLSATHVKNGITHTISQPTMTRDSNGKVTIKPSLIII